MKKAILIMAVALSMGMSAVALAMNVRQCSTPATAQQGVSVKGIPAQPVDLTYAAERAVNSVVYIKVTAKGKTRTYVDPFEDFFGDFFGRGGRGGGQRQYQEPDRKGAGSGVILSADGYIVTNNHVVDEADELTVKLNDNREFKARIIGTDQNSDLALIKIEAKDLQPITIGNSDDLKIGEWVLAIGNPFSLTSTVTAGIVSAKSRTTGGNAVESSIQTDAAINPGNSGGALVNARGELVGINNMIYSQTGNYTGYGFAIPVSIMNKVVADLKEYGTVQRALLGIQGTDVTNYIDQQADKGKDVDLGTTEGIYVAEVAADGAAEEAGLQEGDVITHVDGKKVTKFGELQEILTKHRPGDKVTLTYLRKKGKREATLTLRNAQGTTKALEAIGDDDLGIAFRSLTDKEKQELGLKHGILVTAIRDGKMKDAGVEKGIIITKANDTDVDTQDDFFEAVKRANNSTDRTLWLRAKTRVGQNRSYAIDLGSGK